MAEIYALFSGRDTKVRYVGKTVGDRDTRFKKHLYIPDGGYITRVYTWIHNEWADGFPVETARLQWCGDATNKEIEVLETEWINRFPNLLNKRKVHRRPHKIPPQIPAIKEYKRRFIFNVDGYRGVHWFRDYDRYAIFFHGEWLQFGDELPGGSWSIYFSNRDDAVDARDCYLRGMKARDIQQELHIPEFHAELLNECSVDFDPTIRAVECDLAFESEFAGVIA